MPGAGGSVKKWNLGNSQKWLKIGGQVEGEEEARSDSYWILNKSLAKFLSSCQVGQSLTRCWQLDTWQLAPGTWQLDTWQSLTRCWQLDIWKERERRECIIQRKERKSHIRETMNLLTDADTITDTNRDRNVQKMLCPLEILEQSEFLCFLQCFLLFSKKTKNNKTLTWKYLNLNFWTKFHGGWQYYSKEENVALIKCQIVSI